MKTEPQRPSTKVTDEGYFGNFVPSSRLRLDRADSRAIVTVECQLLSDGGANKYSTRSPPCDNEPRHCTCSTPAPAVFPINLLHYHRPQLSSTTDTYSRDTRLLDSSSRRKHASRKSLILSKVWRCHGWCGQNLFILWSCTYLPNSSLTFFAASISFI